MINYTKSELEFKEFWIKQASKLLGKTDSQTIKMVSDLFDKFYTRSHLEIENTQSAETHNIPADKFFLGAKKNFILNESGTLTWKHKIKLGVIIPIIQNSIQIRQIKKKAKVKAAEIGDSIKQGILNNEEYTFKIIING